MQLVRKAAVRRAAAAAVLVSALFATRSARADVLDEVPADALAVLRINHLEQLNTKVAKMAKTFGLDEINPEMKDPLAAALEKGHMTKGVDKSGDAALVIFAPPEHHKHKKTADDVAPDANAGPDADHEEPLGVALVPVTDYDAFLGNFTKSDEAVGGEITAVKDPENGGKTMYVAHRGKYAVLSDKKDHIHSDHNGIKLGGESANEATSKDMVFFFNMPVLRERSLPELKSHRKEWLTELHKQLDQQAQLKPFIPTVDTAYEEVLDAAEGFLGDADAILFSLNITDEGFAGSGLVDFKADSKWGKVAQSLKAGDQPLLAGLPNVKYFAFGGSSMDPNGLKEVINDNLNPIIKKLNESDNKIGQKLASVLETAKSAIGASNHSVAGIVVPTKPLGQESIFQTIGASYGDARELSSAQKKMMTQLNELMAEAPNQAAKSKVVFGEKKTVDGADLDTYTTKFEFDENDPKGMQAQQMMAMLYGPNGLTGSFGAVNDKTFVVAQGASDELLKQLIDSAKGGEDALSANEGVKMVSAQLPKHSSLVYYVELDNIVSTAVRYAQGFGLPIKIKLPHDQPPIGVAVGSYGSSIRVDSFVPAQTVQSLVAAGIQAYTQMQGGGQGGGL